MTDFGAPVLTQLLPEEDMKLLSSMAVRRCYRSGEMIHDRGDEPTNMGIVVSGSVMLVSPRSNGREIYLSRVKPGQNFGDITIPFSNVCTHRAIAVGDTQVDHISRESFWRLEERPVIAWSLYKVAAYRLALAIRMLDDMRALPADVLFARLLLSFHESMDNARTLEFVQDKFASYLGISLVTLNKVLRGLKQAGLIETGYRQIRLTDPHRLRQWLAEKNPD